MKVTVITQAYNSRDYIRRSIESVLNQTYTNFEYILYDNGSTDGTGHILDEYAHRDKRIKLLRAEENYPGVKWCDILLKEGTGDYFTELDSDDWLEPNFLEKMVQLAESDQYDIISTGTLFHQEGVGVIGARKIDQRVILENRDFGNAYLLYSTFFITYWAKLISMKVFKRTELVKNIKRTGLSLHCIDGVICSALLRNSNKICVDDSVLHHYLYHSSSTTFKFDPSQFYGAVYLLKDSIDFLFPYGPVSQQNMTQIFSIYANQVSDVAKNINGTSSLGENQKMAEYRYVLTHEITQVVYRYNGGSIQQSKITLFQLVLACASHMTDSVNVDFEAIKSVWFPNCGAALSPDNAELFLLEQDLFQALFRDDKLSLSIHILSLAASQKYAGRFDLVGMGQRLLSKEEKKC